MVNSRFQADHIVRTASEWMSVNPYLAKNDLGIESDTGKMKAGVGARWSDTGYLPGSINDPEFDGNTYGRKDGEWVNLASAAALQFRQGTNADRLAMSPVPAVGEPIYTTDGKRLFIGDGVTVGGRGLVGDTDSYIVCQPGDDLPTKYAQAKLLTPGGSALSATNRGRLVVFPGTYVINTNASGYTDATGLVIDANYVDVFGVGSTTWNPSFSIAGTKGLVRVTAEDVVLTGLRGSTAPGGGGSLRYLVNCAGATVYGCGLLPVVGGIPNVIGGTLIGCHATGELAGASSSGVNVFNGTIIGCRADAFVCRSTIFQGVIRNSLIAINSTFNSFRGFQGRIEHTALTGLAAADLWARSGDYSSVPAAFGSTCTISNASPAVVTETGHGLRSGMRIQFSTTGTLPSGLSPAFTYYVTVIDSNTFSVSEDLNGDLVNTTTAGSGTHTIVVPAGFEGGRYSYCTTRDGEFTTT